MEESAIFDEVVDIVVKGGTTIIFMILSPRHASTTEHGSVYDAWIDKITS